MYGQIRLFFVRLLLNKIDDFSVASNIHRIFHFNRSTSFTFFDAFHLSGHLFALVKSFFVEELGFLDFDLIFGLFEIKSWRTFIQKLTTWCRYRNQCTILWEEFVRIPLLEKGFQNQISALCILHIRNLNWWLRSIWMNNH